MTARKTRTMKKKTTKIFSDSASLQTLARLRPRVLSVVGLVEVTGIVRCSGRATGDALVVLFSARGRGAGGADATWPSALHACTSG